MGETVKQRLSVEQATALLGDEESIHTFRSGPMMLVGADWNRSELVDAIELADGAEIGGDACRAMGHGLVVWTGDDPLFVECDDSELAKLERCPTTGETGDET